jgi:hypothetical protein
MQSLENNPLRLTRAGILMLAWGTLVLVGGILSQWVFNNSIDGTLMLWGIITLVGVAVQLACQVRDQGVNCGFWLVAIAFGWAFTLYVLKMSDFSLYGSMAGVWLVLFGLAYIPTARQIDSRFMTLAIIHLVVGLLIILSAQNLLKMELLDTYSPLVLGVIGGGSLMVAAFMSRVPQPAPLQAQPPA